MRNNDFDYSNVHDLQKKKVSFDSIETGSSDCPHLFNSVDSKIASSTFVLKRWENSLTGAVVSVV